MYLSKKLRKLRIAVRKNKRRRKTGYWYAARRTDNNYMEKQHPNSSRWILQRFFWDHNKILRYTTWTGKRVVERFPVGTRLGVTNAMSSFRNKLESAELS